MGGLCNAETFQTVKKVAFSGLCFMERVPVISSFPQCFQANTEKLSYTAPRLVLPTVCFTSHHSQTSHDSAPCTVQTTDYEMIPARGWA